MVKLHVNGKQHDSKADPAMPLLWVLFDVLGLTGSKYSCGIFACGITVNPDPVCAGYRQCCVCRNRKAGASSADMAWLNYS